MQMTLEPERKQFITKILPPWALKFKTCFSQNVIFGTLAKISEERKVIMIWNFQGMFTVINTIQWAEHIFYFMTCKVVVGPQKLIFWENFWNPNLVSVYEKYQHYEKNLLRSLHTSTSIEEVCKSSKVEMKWTFWYFGQRVHTILAFSAPARLPWQPKNFQNYFFPLTFACTSCLCNYLLEKLNLTEKNMSRLIPP